jgi:hypothetical protein
MGCTCSAVGRSERLGSGKQLADESRERDCIVAGLHFAVLPVGTRRSARGQALLTAGPYIMHHGQREHLRNNRYQLSKIDSHVASWGDHSISLNWVQVTSQMLWGVPSTCPVLKNVGAHSSCCVAQLCIALARDKQPGVEQGLRWCRTPLR